MSDLSEHPSAAKSKSRSWSPAVCLGHTLTQDSSLGSRQQKQLSFWRTDCNVGPNSLTRLNEDGVCEPVLSFRHNRNTHSSLLPVNPCYALEWRLASLMQKASCSSLISFNLFSSRNNTNESLMSTTSISFWRMCSSFSHCSGVFSARQTYPCTG